MTIEGFLSHLRTCPLIASVQASEGSPVDQPETLLRLARASTKQGVKVLRLQGIKNIRAIKPKIPLPTIGLIKRVYPDSDVNITPANQDVDSLIELRCEVIATDGTGRPGPKGVSLEGRIAHIHLRKALAMADCDTLESAQRAAAAGADLIGTTLAGYTAARPATVGPDLELLRAVCAAVKCPVVAEGRFSHRWEVEAALRIGAAAVVVGGALNDPVKQTRALLPSAVPEHAVGAIDIGATWLRFGTFSPRWELSATERIPNPHDREKILDWIREMIATTGVDRVGIGTAGVVDPATGDVWKAKEHLIPNYVGIVLSRDSIGIPTFAHGDGHATAWGHACLPQFAGRRVATLALGTGVGCGFVQEGKIWAGRRGEYPQMNDLPSSAGTSYETLLGGINLTEQPTEDQKSVAVQALEGALQAVSGLYFPDDIVIAGSVGLSPWMRPHIERLGAVASPFGPDAGLHGAAALVLFPS